MKILIGIVVACCALVWVCRPYSTSLLRFAVWRALHASDIAHESIDAGDARIAWQEIGPTDTNDDSSGTARLPPLVLLHGGLSSRLDWYALLPSLARNRRIVLIDTRGHGLSTPGDTALSYRLFASDVITVLDHLRIRTADVVGWSDGGNTGLMIALHHPGRVRRLVAISANIDPDGLVPTARQAVEATDPDAWSARRALHALLSGGQARWASLVGLLWASLAKVPWIT